MLDHFNLEFLGPSAASELECYADSRLPSNIVLEVSKQTVQALDYIYVIRILY